MTADGPDGGAADAGADVGAVEADAGVQVDAGEADAGEADAGVGLPAVCEGACRSTTATVSLSQVQVGFQRAFYGLTAPSQSSTGAWEIYLEASSGGAVGCPEENSPTPDWTLILARVPVDTGTAPLTNAAATFLDFSGQLLAGAPLTRASAVQVELVAGALCTDCVGMPAPAHPEGFVALDLQATFPEGGLSGHVFATHCDSMDLGE